jgi:methylenetetrahydrofolate reductase (NADPH)
MCKNIQDTFNIDTVAHLTCISSTKETIQKQLDSIKKSNINNILALRGDLTPELINNPNAKRDYNYAIDLIREIVEYDNLFCIGGACYPEGHPESSSLSDNLIHIKEKVDAGCSFLTTQMFFDNKLLFNFIDKALSININVPILPGIMPITSSKQLYRINTLSGATIPHELQSIITKYENSPLDMEKAGIDYAINQVLDLFNNGINHVHIYTMNKPLVAKKIKENLEGVL